MNKPFKECIKYIKSKTKNAFERGEKIMNRNDCGCLITAIIGVFLGIIVGYNAYLAIIPGITTVLWIGFAIAVGTLIFLTFISLYAPCSKERCICKLGKCLVIPAIGTIITTIVGLAITIVAGSIGVAILIGLVTLFLVMTILNILRFILCLTDSNCKCH